MNWKEKMKGFLVFVMIICMALLLNVYAQNDEIVPEVRVPEVQGVNKPEPTRLKVKIIDEINDKLIKLENCTIQLKGKLHLIEEAYDYTKTFNDGDRYEITIHVRLKK